MPWKSVRCSLKQQGRSGRHFRPDPDCPERHHVPGRRFPILLDGIQSLERGVWWWSGVGAANAPT